VLSLENNSQHNDVASTAVAAAASAVADTEWYVSGHVLLLSAG